MTNINVIESDANLMEEFHKIIKDGSVERLEEELKFLKMNKSLSDVEIKYFFDAQEKSALYIASQNLQYEIIGLLKSKNFSLGKNENFEEIMKSMVARDKFAKQSYKVQVFRFKKPYHIQKIFGMISISPSQNQERINTVFEWLKEIDDVNDVAPILKTIANAKSVKILIDFESIREVDPALTLETHGTTYINLKQIVIGAKITEERNHYDILGTMIHEFCHLAMNLLYKNSEKGCKPYYSSDEESKQTFEGIAKLWNKSSQEKIISNAYGNTLNIHEELIVRVPQLLVRYKNEPKEVERLKHEYEQLFSFYKRKTYVDLEIFQANMATMQAVSELNLSFNLERQLKNYQFECSSIAFQPHENYEKFRIVISNAPMLSMKNIYESLNRTEKSSWNLFLNYHDISTNPHMEQTQVIFDALKKPSFYILHDSQTRPEIKLKEFKFLQELESKKLIVTFILHDSNSNDVETLFNGRFRTETQKHMLLWTDLKDKSKTEVLKKQINFQKRPLTLNKVLNPQMKMLETMPVNNIIELSDIFDETAYKEISLPSGLLTPFYIERKFEIKLNDDGFKVLNEEEIYECSMTSKINILSDIAGMGKTTTFFQIEDIYKRKRSEIFCFVVELRKYSKFFIKDKLHNQTTFDKDVLLKILRITHNFETQLFWELFESGKVLLMLDGYDEISPSYSKYVNILIQFCEKYNTKIWISVRPHLVQDLEQTLNIVSYKLRQFSYEDKIVFFIKYWKTDKKDQRTENEMRDSAENIIKTFERSLNYNEFNDFLGVPLQIRMSVNVDDESMQKIVSENRISLYQFYTSFIDGKQTIYKQKGDLADQEDNELRRNNINIIEFHKYEALRQILGEKKLNLVKLRFKKLNKITPEMKIRFGLLYYKFDQELEYHFVHQTFAEYFVANFIISIISDSDDEYNDDVETELSQAVEVLIEILSDSKYIVIRSFLNSAVETFKVSEESKELLKSVLRKFEVIVNFHYIVIENQAYLLELLCGIIEDKKFGEISKPSDRNSILNIASRNSSPEVINILWEKIKIVSANDYKKIFDHNFIFDGSVLESVFINKNLESFKLVLAVFEEIHDNSEKVNILMKNGECFFLKKSIRSCFPQYFIWIWDTYVQYFGESSTKNLMRQLELKYVLLEMIRNSSSEVMLTVYTKVKTVFTSTEIIEEFRENRFSYFETFINEYSDGMYNNFWFLFEELFDIEQQGFELVKVDKKMRNIFMLLIPYGYHSFVRCFQKVEKILGKNKIAIKRLFYSLDCNNENLRHYLNNRENEDKELKKFIYSYVETFTDDEIKLFKEWVDDEE